MNTSILSIRANMLRKSLPLAFALGALAVMSVRAQAAEPDEVTITAPAVKTIGREPATLALVEEVTVTAHVAFNPVTLTTNSGVALLNDSVLEAARKACDSADPLMQDDGTCVTTAVKSAKPQVDAAIARAKSSANG